VLFSNALPLALSSVHQRFYCGNKVYVYDLASSCSHYWISWNTFLL